MSQLSWESSPQKQLSLVDDEEVISLSHAKVYVFSDSVLCLGKMNQKPTSNTAWERLLDWFKNSLQNRTLDTIDGEPMEFEWNIFPGFSTLELVREVQKVMSKMSEPEQLQGRIIFMSMFNDIMSGNKDNETECIANSALVSSFAKRFSTRRWSFLGLGSEKQWYSTDKERPQGEWDRVAELVMINSEKADTQISEPRVRCLEERSKAKEVENCLYTSVPMVIRLKLFFAHSFLSISSVSTEQSQICEKSTVAVEQEQGDLFFCRAI